jgi:hypothetical protein
MPKDFIRHIGRITRRSHTKNTEEEKITKEEGEGKREKGKGKREKGRGFLFVSPSFCPELRLLTSPLYPSL